MGLVAELVAGEFQEDVFEGGFADVEGVEGEGAGACEGEEGVEGGLGVGSDGAVGLVGVFELEDVGEGLEGGVGEGGLGGEFDACADVGLGEEILGSVEGDDFGVVHDGDAVAEDFGFVHVVGGEDDGFAFGFDLFDEVPKVAAGLGVEAGGGFVEEENFGIVDEADGDGEALLLSAGEFFGFGVGFFGELNFFEELEGIDFSIVAGGEGLDEFEEVEVFEKGGGLELYADDGFDVVGMFLDVDSFDENGAGCGLLEAFDHFEGGGFAGAVGAEDAEGFALLDGEGDVLDGGEGGVFFGEVLDLDAGGQGEAPGLGWDLLNGGTIAWEGLGFNRV